jgi:hypothetical protein
MPPPPTLVVVPPVPPGPTVALEVEAPAPVDDVVVAALPPDPAGLPVVSVSSPPQASGPVIPRASEATTPAIASIEVRECVRDMKRTSTWGDWCAVNCREEKGSVG